MTIPGTEMVVVERAYLERIVTRLEEIEEMVNNTHQSNTFVNRCMAMARGGMLTASSVCKLCGWSRSTLTRKLASGSIIMTRDGKAYKIDVDDFVKWYQANYKN